MPLKAFTEFTQAPLEVQYEPGGKVYRIPPVTIEAGATLHAATVDPDAARKAGEGEPADAMPRLVLGPLWDEMKADGVPAAFADRVYLTALADFQGGREYAEHLWEVGIDPKVVQAFLEKQQESQPPVSKRSPRTGEGTSTRSPASTSSTTSKTPRRK